MVQVPTKAAWLRFLECLALCRGAFASVTDLVIGVSRFSATDHQPP
jgi:hypothetical protein